MTMECPHKTWKPVCVCVCVCVCVHTFAYFMNVLFSYIYLHFNILSFIYNLYLSYSQKVNTI